jgi:hypothetical protein
VRRVLLIACAVGLATPAAAQAATTVGSSLRTRANLFIRCNTTCTAIQSARPGGEGLEIPDDGVITRWRVRAATQGAVRLRIVRKESNGGYTSITVGDEVSLNKAHAPGQDVLYEFPVRIPVQAGDTIGLDRDSRAGGIFHSYSTDTSYAVADFAPRLKDAAIDQQPTSNSTGRELLLNVDVEKDGDGDGFGDESQDNCPTVANDQTDKPCSTPTPEPTQTPTGPTSTPVDNNSNPQQHSQGSEGPAVQGERGPAEGTRRHGRKRAPRKRPPRASDPLRGHSRSPKARARPPRSTGPDSTTHGTTPKARPKPPRPTAPDSTGHGDQPSPRKKPVSHRKPTKKHTTSPGARDAPPATEPQQGEAHDQSPSSRPAPKAKPHKRTRRHKRKPARPAPPPAQPSPGWQPH